MKVETALTYFWNQAELAKALGLKRQQVNFWKTSDGVIPAKHAIRLQAMTNGKLKVDPKCYEKKGARSRV